MRYCHVCYLNRVGRNARSITDRSVREHDEQVCDECGAVWVARWATTIGLSRRLFWRHKRRNLRRVWCPQGESVL